MIQEFGDQQAPSFGANYRRHEVNKAVIMNSADKLIDNGTVQYKGNAIAQGNLLGMERTVVKTDGTSNWLDSTAFDNFNINSPEPLSGGFFTLDEQMGTGHLNAKRALQQFIPGEQEPDGANVPLIGWDYGTMSGNAHINKYAFDTQLSEGEFISITLAWDREVNFATGGGDGTFDEGDTFQDYTNTDPDFDIIANDVISDLDLYLMPAGSFSINQHVAVSAGIDSTLEHIFFPIPATGSYEIWVDQVDDDAGNPDYGLAWWAGLAPDIPVPNPVSDFDGDGNVDGADLAQWQGDYGLNNMSDADGDGDSDGTDFLAWQQNFTGPPTAGVSMTEGITTGGNEMYEISLDIPEGAEGTFDTFVLTVTPDAGSTFNQVGTPTAGVTQPSEDTGFVASLTAPPFFDGQGLVSVGIEDTSVLMEGTFGSIASNDASEQGDYLLAQIVMANAGGSGTYAIRFIDDGVEVATTNGSFGGGSLMAVPEPTTGLLLASMLGLVAANRSRSRLIVR